MPFSAGSVRISANTQLPTIARRPGSRLWLTRLHSRQPGTAPSRENAYIMREQLVTQAMPQNSWPIVEMRITTSPSRCHRARKTAIELPPASLIAFDVGRRRT